MQASGNEIIILVVVCVVALILVYLGYRIYSRRRMAGWLRMLWGKKADRSITADEMANIHDIASFLQPSGEFGIDDTTWNDLEMDRVYTRMSHCLTNAGDQMLYATLRNPDGPADQNMQTIRWAEDSAARDAVRLQLYAAGRAGDMDIRMLLKDNPFQLRTQVISVLLCIGLTASIVFASLGFAYAIFAMLAFFFINGVYAYKTHQDNARYITSIGYLTSVIRCAQGIRRVASDIPLMNSARVGELLAATRQIRRNATLELFYNTDSITMLLNSLFLLENMSFGSLAKAVVKRREEVLELYRMVGTLDAMIAAASWRKSLHSFCEPEIIAQGEPFLQTEGLTHPLLDDAVENDLHTHKGILITGSNATGKSTFIKAIAVSAVLAQSIGTCTAKRWQASRFRILTSMALRDNITAGESYFVTEIRSLRRMLDAAQAGGAPCLCVIDEVLRGTNTGERIAASGELLLRFSTENCLCIAATHDTELAIMLEHRLTNMHFTEQIGSDGMLFDYKLKQGRSTSSNAIKLLGQMGYGKDIVEGAQRRLDTFSKTGVWPTDDMV